MMHRQVKLLSLPVFFAQHPQNDRGNAAQKMFTKLKWLDENITYDEFCKLFVIIFQDQNVLNICKEIYSFQQYWRPGRINMFPTDNTNYFTDKIKIEKQGNTKNIDFNDPAKWPKIILRKLTNAEQVRSRNYLALRGHSEKILNSKKRLFLDLIELITLNEGKSKTSCFSPTIKNEFIELMGKTVKNKILEIIKKNTPDFHTKNKTKEKTGTGVASDIVDKLQVDGLNINNCRGQGFDNEANMAGRIKGVQANITKLNELAFYFMMEYKHSDTHWSSKKQAISDLHTNIISIAMILQQMRDTTNMNYDTIDKYYYQNGTVNRISRRHKIKRMDGEEAIDDGATSVTQSYLVKNGDLKE
ncbi:hypothetical protein AGLY_012194 [Aphis glycines]|uniref:DUF4371 domain-containing protein n=1 Tax=Aphis glycines TaxID=307491 RepID=A0A6G0T9R5_APHGL|nr:hypothetical protein AGLY_012194 [Aphis glycines]